MEARPQLQLQRQSGTRGALVSFLLRTVVLLQVAIWSTHDIVHSFWGQVLRTGNTDRAIVQQR